MIRLNYSITNEQDKEALKSFFIGINVKNFFKIVEKHASVCGFKIKEDDVSLEIRELYKKDNFRINCCIDIDKIVYIEYRLFRGETNFVFNLHDSDVKKTISLCVTLFKVFGLKEDIRIKIKQFLIDFIQDERKFNDLKKQQKLLTDRLELLRSSLQEKYCMNS